MSQNGTAPITHQFSRSEIKMAEHAFAEMIKKHFGEVWKLPATGKYRGVSLDLRTPLAMDQGLWNLVQMAKHRGAKRAAGRLETREAGYVLRFIIFYDLEGLLYG